VVATEVRRKPVRFCPGKGDVPPSQGCQKTCGDLRVKGCPIQGIDELGREKEAGPHHRFFSSVKGSDVF
jgi:hypothetical protein